MQTIRETIETLREMISSEHVQRDMYVAKGDASSVVYRTKRIWALENAIDGLLNPPSTDAQVATLQQLVRDLTKNPNFDFFALDYGDDSGANENDELAAHREAHLRIDSILMSADVFEVVKDGGPSEAWENTITAVSKLVDRVTKTPAVDVLELCGRARERFGAMAHPHAAIDWIEEHVAAGQKEASLLRDLETIWHSVSDDKDTNAAYLRLKEAIAGMSREKKNEETN